MAKRTGEKIGWVGGWMGGFLWVLILSIVWLVQGRTVEGITGLMVVGLAVVLIFAAAPWKHPTAPCGKLMIPLYVMLGISVVWAVWSFGEAARPGVDWKSMWWVMVLLIPVGTLGRRKWIDGERPGATSADQGSRIG